MTCERCFKPLDEGAHGLYQCPLEPRRFGVAVWQDTIEGGVLIEHGLCNEDGTPRRFNSRSEIRQACAVKGLIPWTDVYTEDRTKDARVHDDWLKSGEAQHARKLRVEARRMKGREY